MEKLAAAGVWTDERVTNLATYAAEPAPWRAPAGEGLTLLTHATTTLGEGEGANLPWMQELAGWQHHIGWDTWIEVHPKHGFASGEIVEVASARGNVRARVVATEAIHPEAVAMPRGGGRTAGRWAKGRGANALVVGGNPSFRTRVTLRRV
jgi:molybdopterin-containing oxidoreductase family iron-sulfur binding subunit